MKILEQRGHYVKIQCETSADYYDLVKHLPVNSFIGLKPLTLKRKLTQLKLGVLETTESFAKKLGIL